MQFAVSCTSIGLPDVPQTVLYRISASVKQRPDQMNVRPGALPNQSFGWKEVSKCHRWIRRDFRNSRKSSLRI